MQQHRHTPSLSDDSAWVAWREQLALAAEHPWLIRQLLGHWQRALARFMHFYRQLLKLPRNERRRLQRRIGVGVAGAAMLVALSNPAAAMPGATITVDGALCTLIEAITAANTDLPAGGCVGGSGADTIDLQVDVTLRTVSDEAYGPTGLPVVTSPITIQGNGHSIQRKIADGMPEFRILAVDANGNLTLQSTTVSNGSIRGFSDLGQRAGGGILVRNGGMLTVANSTLSSNSVGGGGGGIGAFSGATVTVLTSTLTGNSAGRGGGIFSEGDALTVTDSVVRDNQAYWGGGVFSTGTATLSRSTFSGNTAVFEGGGIINYGMVTIADSTVSGNESRGIGGGVSNGGTVTVSNSTLAGNRAAAGGGVGAFHTSTTVIQNSSISGNAAEEGGGLVLIGDESRATVQNSVLALQTYGNDCAIAGALTSAGFNVESGAACRLTALGDQQNVTADQLKLGGLAANGGPTETMALASGSVAIDRLPRGTNGCGTEVISDQRGQPRPLDGNGDGVAACDTGAYEAAAQAPPTPGPPPAEIPEPLTLLLVGSGLAGLAAYAGRRLGRQRAKTPAGG